MGCDFQKAEDAAFDQLDDMGDFFLNMGKLTNGTQILLSFPSSGNGIEVRRFIPGIVESAVTVAYHGYVNNMYRLTIYTFKCLRCVARVRVLHTFRT